MSFVTVEIASSDYAVTRGSQKTIKVNISSFNEFLAPYCTYLGNDSFRFNPTNLLEFVGNTLQYIENVTQDE